ncbi:MAG: carboxypeptidase-like regulatory domain-containing protein [Paludibacter sp.]
MKNKLQERFTLKRITRFAQVLFIILINIVPINAQSTSVQIKKDIKVTNVTVLQLVDKLGADFKYSFFIVDEIIGKTIISVELKNATINEILESAFQGKDIVYVVKNKNITISTKNKKKTEQQVTNKTKKITGVVLDEKGQPVIGASVIIPGTTIGIATDINGRFTLDAPLNSKIRISYIGYEAKEESLKSDSDLKISLQQTSKVLTEIVATAQAIGQKNAIRQQINSNTIKNVVAADRLQENPDANTVEALGRLPGVSVIRDGGEGSQLQIRGMDPRYMNVTLNGMQIGSLNISQFALQGAELTKSLTADMDANSTAGTINLLFREAPKGFHGNFMAQGGYNNMNKYFGNYKFMAELSNRFFDNKLGVMFNAVIDNTNRSTQNMSAGYYPVGSDLSTGLYSTGINLTLHNQYFFKKSAMLNLDFKPFDNTSLFLINSITQSGTKIEDQSKSFGLLGVGSVAYNFGTAPNRNEVTMATGLTGKTDFGFMVVDYGISYNNYNRTDDKQKSWGWFFANKDKITIPNTENLKDPLDLIPLFNTSDSIKNNLLGSFGLTNDHATQHKLESFINFTVPFKIGDKIKGSIKFGGKMRNTNDYRYVQQGGCSASPSNVPFQRIMTPLMPDLTWNGGYISAIGMENQRVNDFLGKYDFGYTYDMNKLNQIFDTWYNVTDQFSKMTDKQVADAGIFDRRSVSFTQSVQTMTMLGLNAENQFNAVYIMPEINFGKFVTFIPGVRYENTITHMKGYYATPPMLPPEIQKPIPGRDTLATRTDNFILPMIHLRIKPSDKFYTHISYTQTLSRPDLGSMMPNYYLNTGWAPFSYVAGNPKLLSELWTNYDLQFVYHDDKFGLISMTGFYKVAENKFWERQYKRVKGDPIPDPNFKNTDLINMDIWENNKYKSNVGGIEFEWQTNFTYMKNFLKYITITANYTVQRSQAYYPTYSMRSVILPGQTRPQTIRVDSVISGKAVGAPDQIANISVGFCKDGYNIWLSYQHTGGIIKGINNNPELNIIKDPYERLDLQLTKKFSIARITGFEFMVNLANLTNSIETEHYAVDTRFTSIQRYGWSVDTGFRWRF